MASAFKTELDAQGSNLSMYPFDLSVLDSTRVSPRYKAQLCNEIFSVAMMQGYFAIVGHGITESERDEFLTAQKAFFELPEENKKELAPVELEYRGYLEKEEAVCPVSTLYLDPIARKISSPSICSRSTLTYNHVGSFPHSS